MSLLDDAKKLPTVVRDQKPVPSGELELIVAFLKSEITPKQVAPVIGVSNKANHVWQWVISRVKRGLFHNQLFISIKGDIMSDKKYNGWTNYETWNLKLWLDNEEYWHNDMTSQADVYATDQDKNTAVSDMVDYLKEWVNENTPDLYWPDDMGGGKITASMFNNILNAGLSEINYYEIAESYIDEAILNLGE